MALPAQNRLLPEAFALAQNDSEPRQVVDGPGLSVWLQGSEAFATLPRGYTQVYFNSPLRQQQVDSAVTAAVVGSLQSGTNGAQQRSRYCRHGTQVGLDQGLRLSLSGFTDKQPELLAAALKGLRIKPTQRAGSGH